MGTLRAAYGSTMLGLLGEPKRDPWSEVFGFGSKQFAVVLVMGSEVGSCSRRAWTNPDSVYAFDSSFVYPGV